MGGRNGVADYSPNEWEKLPTRRSDEDKLCECGNKFSNDSSVCSKCGARKTTNSLSGMNTLRANQISPNDIIHLVFKMDGQDAFEKPEFVDLDRRHLEHEEKMRVAEAAS